MKLIALVAFILAIASPGFADGPFPATNLICGTSGEWTTLKLKCPVGESFSSIRFASFGNPTGSCGNFSLGSCNAAASVQRVSDLCLGNSNCSINVDYSNFGDPCPGTQKILAVQAVCSPTSVCGTSGEWTNLQLTCPPDQTIEMVKFASFGTPTGTCRNFMRGSCHASYSTQVVRNYCLGLNACSIPVNWYLYGDPCPGVPKRLSVEVICSSFPYKLTNGDFEEPACNSSQCTFNNFDIFPGWNVTWGKPSQQRYDLWQPACGDYSVNANNNVSDSFPHTFQHTFQLPAGKHHVEYALAANSLCTAPHTVEMRVGIRGSQNYNWYINAIDATGNSTTNMGWEFYVMEFDISNDANKAILLEFTPWGNGGAPCGAVLDCVRFID